MFTAGKNRTLKLNFMIYRHAQFILGTKKGRNSIIKVKYNEIIICNKYGKIRINYVISFVAMATLINKHCRCKRHFHPRNFVYLLKVSNNATVILYYLWTTTILFRFAQANERILLAKQLNTKYRSKTLYKMWESGESAVAKEQKER